MRLPGVGLQSPIALVQSLFFLLLLVIGIGGLLYDSGVSQNINRVSEFHGMFAFLLAASVAARFHWGLRRLGGPANIEWSAFTRTTSRLIYLLLYALLAAQLFIDFRKGADGHAMSLNSGHCWAYVQYGVLAQLLLRVLAYFAK